MSDTVFSNATTIVTRFWGGKKKDCVQITLVGEARDKGYTQMSLEEFKEAYKAVEASVEETKDAFWHNLGERRMS